MHMKNTIRILLKMFVYMGVQILKLNFSKVISLTYFGTETYRAVEKNDLFQRERGC